MRLIVICLFLAAVQVFATEQEPGAPGGQEESEFDRLDISGLLISAERILVCTPLVKAAGLSADYVLVELEGVHDLLAQQSRVDRHESSFVVVSKTMTLDMPALMPEVKNLLFLVKKGVDHKFLEKHGLDENAGIYELCANSSAAICLDFGGESFRKSIIWRKYQLDKADEFVSIVSDLIAWRALPDIEKVQALVDLLNSSKAAKQSLYQDNVIPMLKRLGKKVVKLHDQYRLEE